MPAEQHQMLDNPAWHALTGPHARHAEVAGPARRYRPDLSFFSAVDTLDDRGWAALAELAGPGCGVMLARYGLETAPAGWSSLLRLDVHQMVATELVPPGPGAVAAAAGLRPLTAADVPAMLALVGLTQPGPFLAGTVELGGYVGVEEDGRLVAMAGERMRLPGHAELSAVCTHPDARGRGLASALTYHVARAIQARGETPLLHVADENEGARRLYEGLGFVTRRTLDFALLATPEHPPPERRLCAAADGNTLAS